MISGYLELIPLSPRQTENSGTASPNLVPQKTTLGHSLSLVFDSILDTSSPQPYDKQDGGRSVRHIAYDTFACHEVWVKVNYDWFTALFLCLCLCRPSFH